MKNLPVIRPHFKVMEMCNCIETAAEKLKQHLLVKVPDGAEVSESMLDTGWENTMFSLGDSKLHVMLKYRLAYRAKKKNGEMAKNMNRLEASLQMTFCPLCGEKLE